MLSLEGNQGGIAVNPVPVFRQGFSYLLLKILQGRAEDIANRFDRGA